MATSLSKPMSPWMRFFFARLFPLPFILIGTLTLYHGGKHLQRARESVSWPTAEGVIQRSSVEYHRSSKGGGTYHAEVMYEFTVNDRVFSSDQVAFGDYGSSNPSHARRIVNSYSQGNKVTVRYLRENPEVSVLEPGMKGQVWFLPAFGLIFLTAGCLMAVCLPRQMAKATPTTPDSPTQA